MSALQQHHAAPSLSSQQQSATKKARPNPTAADDKPQYWLVKIPAFVAEEWKTKLHTPGVQLGSIDLVQQLQPAASPTNSSQQPAGSRPPPEMSFNLHTNDSNKPQHCKVMTRPLRHMVVFGEPQRNSSEQKSDGDSKDDGIECQVEGRVDLIADIQAPVNSAAYTMLMDNRNKRQLHQRTTLQMKSVTENANLNLAPERARLVAAAAMRKQQLQQQKSPKRERRVASSAEEVKPLLYELFSKKDGYTMNELQDATSQPRSSLQLILQDIAEFSRTGEFAGKWVLKYRTERVADPNAAAASDATMKVE